MEQYISKSVLIAEIEKIKKSISPNRFLSEYEKGCNQGKEDICDDLLSSFDTLKVKEVDLEKEFNNFLDSVEGVPRIWHSDEQIGWGKDIAKHFFELGIITKKEEDK